MCTRHHYHNTYCSPRYDERAGRRVYAYATSPAGRRRVYTIHANARRVWRKSRTRRGGPTRTSVIESVVVVVGHLARTRTIRARAKTRRGGETNDFPGGRGPAE